MNLKDIVRIGKTVWKLIKRPDTALLAASGLFLGFLDAFWAFQGIQFTIEAIALLCFSILFLVLAAGIALRRRDVEAWKPFLGAAGLSLAFLLLYGDFWPFYAFPAACAILTAYLYATGDQDAT